MVVMEEASGREQSLGGDVHFSWGMGETRREVVLEWEFKVRLLTCGSVSKEGGHQAGTGG